MFAGMFLVVSTSKDGNIDPKLALNGVNLELRKVFVENVTVLIVGKAILEEDCALEESEEVAELDLVLVLETFAEEELTSAELEPQETD
jgi:hypothetical protein